MAVFTVSYKFFIAYDNYYLVLFNIVVLLSTFVIFLLFHYFLLCFLYIGFPLCLILLVSQFYYSGILGELAAI
jgi:hypothetical protein